jgi:RimJ/RimL family protein N-acetyltransferase
MLIDKNTNQVVGASGLLVQEVDGTTELEIGYQLLPEYWHKGYATEATQTIRNYAFQNNFADSIISIIHVDNIASKKVAIRNGMSLEKTTKYKDFPVDVFRISKKDWEKIIS